MKDSELEVLRLHPRLVQNSLDCSDGSPKICRLSREAAAVLGVKLVLAAPEIGSIGHERKGLIDCGDHLIVIGSDDKCCRACRGGIFQSVTGCSLGCVGADAQAVFDQASLDQTVCHEHPFGAGFAGELEIGAMAVRRGPDRLGDSHA